MVLNVVRAPISPRPVSREFVADEALLRVADNTSNWITWATNRPESLNPLQRASQSIIAAHKWLSLPGQNLGFTKSNRRWERGENAGIDRG